MVVFSAVITCLMAEIRLGIPHEWFRILMLTIGGFFVTGASNSFNQVIEKDLDKLMTRTENRPMPKERLSITSALIFSSATGISGLFILYWFINPLSALLGLIALVLYVAIYTPLKKITPFAVFIGAFPGAIPPLLGWVAASGSFQFEGWILFAIQFIWQFPHFWALAWMLEEDYGRAGFRMLPASDGRSKTSALQIMFYTAGLIPIGILPYVFGISGVPSAMISLGAGLFMMIKSMKLHKTLEIKDARSLLFSSFIYLPVVQLALMFDTIKISQ